MLKIFQFPNGLRISLLLILSFGVSSVLMGNETVKRYYPVTPGSYWVYSDQNGKELTRHAAPDKQHEGNTYHHFQYDPERQDQGFFLYQIHPYLYTVNENGVAYLVGNKGELAVQRRHSKLLEIVVPSIREGLRARFPKSDFDFSFTVDVAMSDTFQLLPAAIRNHKKWEAMKTEIIVTFTTKEEKEGEKPERTTFKTHTDFEETGIVKGTESVKTPAGTFKDCLVVRFENKEVASRSTKNEVGGFKLSHSPIITNIWFAPDVGIVKWEYDSEDAKNKSVFKLKRYEIKPASSGSE